MDGVRAVSVIERHYTTAELAGLLAVHPETIRRAAASARLGSVRVGRDRRYPESAVLGWLQQYLMAGVAQRTVYGLRREVEAKLARLPLKYFDSHPHGDLLSRVTNDVDNIATTLQQGMSQLLTSFLTVVGVLAMMLWISPLLAVISILTIPLTLVVTVVIAGRSQKEFVAQWARTGALNGHVEQMHTGHALVQVFGRRQIAIAQFDQLNEGLYAASFKAPAGRPRRRLGGLRRRRGHWWLPRRVRNDDAWGRAGLHPVLAPVHDAAHADRRAGESPSVWPRICRACL